ncbi:MAG: cation-translocating P-type ATPase [Anaerolineaceae bacterium]|nr:cation-translocating P-type ATPase [Anaerolineaceae bacterium]
MSEWYQQDSATVLQNLKTNQDKGLSEEEVQERLQKYGKNELIDRGGKSPWKILWEQTSAIMTVILIIAAAISMFLGDLEDAIAILAIVILNIVLGFTQEYRAEQAMAALKKMSVPFVKVRRNDHILEISSSLLVPGDIVFLETGNLVPADGRIVESINLRVQEAVLTGESEPVEKTIESFEGNLALGDQRNRVFSGTVVTYGRGTVVITETGMQTELGKIATMIQDVESEPTPLQRRLDQLAKGLAIAALLIVIVVFSLGLLRGEDMRLMFMTAISMAVAAVPEGLAAVVTIGLALGSQRMLKRRALIRKLAAVETLGSVTVICSDKTGTLTENRMTVTFLDVANHQLDLKEVLEGFSPTVSREEIDKQLNINATVGLLLAGSALCNDAVLEAMPDNPDKFMSVGDPTEGALVIAAARGDLWKKDLEQILPRVSELPFDSERKRMTTVHSLQDSREHPVIKGFLDTIETPESYPFIAFTKGAVDGLLKISDRIWVDGVFQPLNSEWLQRIEDANNRLAQNGMRVLGLACQLRKNDRSNDANEPLESQMVFIGLAGMIDPARPEVKESVRLSHQAGIRPIMITGDHPLTALHIAFDLGITTKPNVLTGQELSEIDDQQLTEAIRETSVFARVSPEHKLRIVQALQKEGQIVAMTGDGVNDAPALKKADIGVAMGITGTDVSKEAADMVLLDDNFTTIVTAVEEGRRIYDNIRKFIKYTLGSNVGEILVILVAPFMGMPIPLLPLQILWVNLVTDGLPGLALTMETSERNTMQRPPFHPKESIFGRGVGRNIIFVGLLLGLLTLAVGLWAYQDGRESWQTLAFTTRTLGQMGNVLALRSNRESVFSIGLFSNRLMLGAILLTFLLQMAVVYVPFLQAIFETTALTGGELLLTLTASAMVFVGVEVEKFFVRKLNLKS